MHNGNEKECLLNLYWPSNSWLPDVSCKPGRQKKYSLFSLNIFSPISFSFYSFWILVPHFLLLWSDILEKGELPVFFILVFFGNMILTAPATSSCWPFLKLHLLGIFKRFSRTSFPPHMFGAGKKDFFYRGEWVRSVTGKEWQKFVIFCEKPFLDIVMLGFFIIA